ncbi:MerR family transcriptional regulator [soil metagenome]
MVDEPEAPHGRPTDDALEAAAASPRQPLGLQGTLFDDLPEDQRPGGAAQGIGYRGPTACSAAGITYRQLDYWARTGLVEPSVREASGSGTSRLYSFRDILVLKVVKKLLDAGVSLVNIRTAIGTLRDRGVADLAQITLMSDGTTVYECTSTDEVVDLLQGGQAVFAIAVGRHVRDVEGTLAALPGERATSDSGPVASDTAADELASRRRRRTPA